MDCKHCEHLWTPKDWLREVKLRDIKQMPLSIRWGKDQVNRLKQIISNEGLSNDHFKHFLKDCKHFVQINPWKGNLIVWNALM